MKEKMKRAIFGFMVCLSLFLGKGFSDAEKKVGIGFLGGYGTAGVDFEVEKNRLSGIISGGAIPFTFCWGLGAKYYLVGTDYKYRPSILFTYGNNYLSYAKKYNDDRISIQGVQHGIHGLMVLDQDIGKIKGFVLNYGAGVSVPMNLRKIEIPKFNISESDPPYWSLMFGIKYVFNGN